jgi:hypothetical protein
MEEKIQKVSLNLSSTLKTGIPTKLIRESTDPFKTLNDIIFSSDDVVENIRKNSNIPKCIFDISHLDFFVIKKISDFLFTKKPDYFNDFINKCSERLDELLNKYSRYISSYEDIILVHTCSTGDSLYVSGLKKNLKYPFISLSNENNEFFIATARNYLYSYSQDI